MRLHVKNSIIIFVSMVVYESIKHSCVVFYAPFCDYVAGTINHKVYINESLSSLKNKYVAITMLSGDKS